MKTTGLTQYTSPSFHSHSGAYSWATERFGGQSPLTGFDYFIFALDPSIRSACWVSQLTASPPFL